MARDGGLPAPGGLAKSFRMKTRRCVIFGPGRVGVNFAAYARHLGHEARLVTRAEAENEAEKCRLLMKEADIVAAALPDGALEGWARLWGEALAGKRAIHFSGALLIEGVLSYHPLYSFPKSELAPEAMRAIAFAREEGAPAFAEILPGAPNPDFVVTAEDRAFYHALAVLSGNFAAHLWNETAKAAAGRLGVEPCAMLGGYLAGILERFRESPFDSLTGPVARRDRATVEANLAALAGEPRLKALYEAFVKSAWPGY